MHQPYDDQAVASSRSTSAATTRASRSCLTAQTMPDTQATKSTAAVTATPTPGTPTASRIVLELVSTIMPPAATPSTRAARCLTSQAAMGAATTPPASSAPAYPQLMPWLPRARRKPSEPPTATTNSDVS